MKKNELITLVAGIAVIVFLAWAGGLFSASFNSTNEPKIMNQKTSTLPEVKGTNISQDPKLQIIEVQAGTGAEAKEKSHVYVNYTGMLEDGTKFDSSYDRKEPIDFILGAQKVIKGWDMGILGMKVGGKRRLIISSDYAYGNAGVPGVIPANATLVFDVELVSVK